MVDGEINKVFPAVTIDLVQRLNMGVESNHMHFTVKFHSTFPKSCCPEWVVSFGLGQVPL